MPFSKTLLDNWKSTEHESDDDTNCNWRSVQSTKEQNRDEEIRGRVETIQVIALLGSARILKRVLKTWACSHSDSSWCRTSGTYTLVNRGTWWRRHVSRCCLAWVPGWPSNRVTRPRLTYTSSPRRPSPQALTLLGVAWVIALCLRRSFLGEYRRSPRYFGECLACLGYVPASEPTLKRSWATLARLVGHTTNTVTQTPVENYQLTLVGRNLKMSKIIIIIIIINLRYNQIPSFQPEDQTK